MNLVVSQLAAAFPEKHVHRDEKLQKSDNQPRGDLISRPEQEKRIEHVKKPKI
jgi:hypothetical protein